MEKIKTTIKSIIESKYFMIVLALITILSYSINVPFIAYLTLVIIITPTLLLKAEPKAIIGYFMLSAFSDRSKGLNKIEIIILLIVSIPAILGLIYYIIKNYKYIYETLRSDVIFMILTLIIILALVSILNSPDRAQSLKGVRFLLSSLIIYISARLLVYDKNYLAYSIIILSISLSIILFINIGFRLNEGSSFKDILNTKCFIGNSHQNHIMSIINISFVVSLYYFINNKNIGARILVLINMALFFITNVISACRAGYLGLIVTAPFMLAYYIKYHKKIKDDIPYAIVIFIGFLAVIITLLGLRYLDNIFSNLVNRGFYLSERDKIYEYAFDIFKESPLIGRGIFSANYYLKPIGLDVFYYHSYIFQTIAELGIFGAILALGFLGFSIKRVFKNDIFNMMVLLVIIYFLSNGALDTLFYNRIIMPLLLVPLALIRDENNRYSY
jgi:hypothetical protein